MLSGLKSNLLTKKKKKKKNVYLQPLISYFLILQQKKLLSDDRIAFQSRTRYIHYYHHHFIRLFIQDELLDDKWIPSLWDEKFNWYYTLKFPVFLKFSLTWKSAALFFITMFN